MGTPLKPPRPKRYGWLRLYNDFLTHPKWSAVVRKTKIERCRVLCIVKALLIAGNKGKPRGSVADFSVFECAAALEIPEGEVRRVYKSLEACGWIDQEYLTTWDDRQPDKEDPTATERQRKLRKKRRAERMGSGGCHAVTGVTVTPKTTDKDKQEAAVTELSTGQAVTWGDVERAKHVQPRQRALPLGPVPMRRR